MTEPFLSTAGPHGTIHSPVSQKYTIFIFTITLANLDLFIISHCYIQKGIAEEALIKTTTSPQICCHTTLGKVSVQLCNITFILARIVCLMSDGICFTSFYLLTMLPPPRWGHQASMLSDVCRIHRA